MIESKEIKPQLHPYASGLDYIMDELALLNTILRLRISAENRSQSSSPLDNFRGLVITQVEVDQILLELLDCPASHSGLNGCMHRKARSCDIEYLSESILKRRQLSVENGVDLPLVRLKEAYGLTRFEEMSLIISIAPELDRRYEKLYAYLHDDVTRKKPTVDLILDLLCANVGEKILARSAFSLSSPLLKYRLICLGDRAIEQQPLISSSVRLDDRIVDYLLGVQSCDAKVSHHCELVHTNTNWNEVTAPPEARWRMRAFVNLNLKCKRHSIRKTVFSFFGPDHSAKKSLVEATASELSRPIVIVTLDPFVLNGSCLDEVMILIGREAVLKKAVLCVDIETCIDSEEDKSRTVLSAIHNAIDSWPELAFICSRSRLKPSVLSAEIAWIEQEFEIPSSEQRREIWECNGRLLLNDEGIHALAGKFRLTAAEIKNALIASRHQAEWRTGGADCGVTISDINAACRSRAYQLVHHLACKIEPRCTWTDIVLPADSITQLKDMCARIAVTDRVMGEWGFNRKLTHGKGNNALFVGPSGTGKTMAADIIANELGLDLYRIDLAGVVSKYIGETERNLDRIFTAAENASAILFFDEADALFGKRSAVRDSHDRYANIEIAYLLQKMEQYEGITILTTNLRQNVDDAFLRRLQFIVEFPFPDEDQRLQIWKTVFPEKAPRSADVDFDLLAKNLRIAGGSIKNIIVSAAYLAAADGGQITMHQILQAARREYMKLGKVPEDRFISGDSQFWDQ